MAHRLAKARTGVFGAADTAGVRDDREPAFALAQLSRAANSADSADE